LGDLFGNTASKKNLEFLIDLDPSIPCALIGDSLHLSQVLTNLITNAVKFTHSGEVIVRIRSLSQSKQKVKLRFSVIDTGVGVDPEALQSLFDSFTQADSSIKRNYGGTGLGLTISKRLVELMGGHIKVESRPDKGSCFCFTVELDRQPEEHEISFLFSLNMDMPRIMVVEDHAPTRDYLIELIHFLGLDAQGVQTGCEAYRILSGEHDFGLLILDHSIPGEDWFEMARKIDRAQGMRPPLQKLIMFKSMGSEDEMNVQQLESSTGILIKPILLDTLFKGLREKLDRESLIDGLSGRPDSFCPQCNIHGARILLVEDNSINQEVSREFLQKEGAIVVIASTGMEALDMVNKHEFDLVLMDLQMPGMDGYETTRRIRETFDHDVLPIVAMTAHVMKGAKKQCLDAGMDDFLGKPVEIEHFFSVLNRWVGNKGPASEQTNNEADNRSRWADLPMDLPGIELKSVLARLRGNPELLIRLLTEFSESKKDAVKDIRQALRSGDSETALKMLHNLKGLSGNISAVCVYKMSAAIDSAIREGQIDRIPDYLENLEAAMETVFESSSYLNKLEDPASDPHTGTLDVFDPKTLRQTMYQLGAMLEKSSISALDKVESIQMVMPLNIEKHMHELNKFIHKLDFGAAMVPFNEINRLLEDMIGDERVEP
jgi:CheY-like chemotaxis protein/anti-sigma regulatory factor (Ser/Thr protein kinase)